jgi:hypothetical protein
MNTHDYYTEKISSLKANTVENILNIGLIVKDAKNNLSKIDFEKFLQASHYKDKSSSIRKWKKIGDAYHRLNPISHMLPVVWSTIYKLSALSADKFDYLERMQIITPTITAKEIDEKIKFQKSAKSKKLIQITLKFDLSVSAETLKSMHDIIAKSIPKSLCQIKMTEETEALLEAANSSASLINYAA